MSHLFSILRSHRWRIWIATTFLTPAALLSSAAAAQRLAPFNTEKTPGGPVSATAAAAAIQVPTGFRATLFAGEPDLAQPIAITTDTRGRLWVAENYTYSEREVGFHAGLRDRIVIFDDEDNDGDFDRRVVFFDAAERLTSIEVGTGGVWALCPPNLIFIPDRNRDDVPDGPSEVILDGFDHAKSQHNIANGLRWGPDGWLYGRQGILGHSQVGPPGSPPGERVAMNVGVWRFHPRTRAFEVVAEGTTNPWGMDWDAHGEGFFINTVIGHLWHLIPGAHYRRMFGDDPTPHVYDVIEQHADHFHWATAEDWTEVRKGVSSATLARGGGHAHTGLLIYQGGAWPAEWTGKLFTINFHGRRLNVDRLERSGSGFVGKHDSDAFLFGDPWFRGIDLIAAPDGGVFVSDWSDAGECHDFDGVHRSSGRVFKLSYGPALPRRDFDLSRRDASDLVSLQRAPNDWVARLSRRELADRAAAGVTLTAAHRELERMLAEEKETVTRLRALWALHVSGAALSERLPRLLADPDEHVRAWAVRLLSEPQPLSLGEERVAQLARLAQKETSARVRLALASALPRLVPEDRMRVAAALLTRAEDAADHNLPKLLWYGISALADQANTGFARLIAQAKLPMVQRFGARRLAEDIDVAPGPVDNLLRATVANGTPSAAQAVLDGIAEALAGRRKAPAPASWADSRAQFVRGADERLLRRIRDLDALFGDGRALEELRRMALDTNLDRRLRRESLQGLIDARAPGLREACEQLLPVPGLSGTAASGLALSDDPAVAERVLGSWLRFDGAERPRVMSVLVSRPEWAGKVLAAIVAGRVPRAHLTAFHARQIRAYRDDALTNLLRQAWGEVPDEAEQDRLPLLQQWQSRLTPEKLAAGRRENGRSIFRSLCSTCHTLNGEGGKLGPDITGAARDNLNYLLENLLFPSALVADEYRLTTLTLKDGRVVGGMVRSRSGHTVRLQTMTELLIVSNDDVLKEETSPMSLMPPGLLESLSEADARDLIAFLMAKDTAP